ncbi:MAG: AtpZ/AtpI family protein [bacterium]
MAGERDAWSQVGKLTSFGLTMGVAMLACGLTGRWLDGILGTTPVLTVLLFLAGGGSACWYGIVSILR